MAPEARCLKPTRPGAVSGRCGRWAPVRAVEERTYRSEGRLGDAGSALPVGEVESGELVRTVALCVAHVLYVTCVWVACTCILRRGGRTSSVLCSHACSLSKTGIYSYTYTLVSRGTETAKCRRLSYGFSQITYLFALI